jgi:hypothetical protein
MGLLKISNIIETAKLTQARNIKHNRVGPRYVYAVSAFSSQEIVFFSLSGVLLMPKSPS